MDEIAVTLAALECGHGPAPGVDRPALAARAQETGRSLARGRDGALQLVLDDEGAPGWDVLAAPVPVSEHRLCVLGLLLGELGWTGQRPQAGSGPVGCARLAEGLRSRGRDDTSSLITSLRSLAQLRLIEYDQARELVWIGPALSAQPPAFFASLANARERA